MYVFFYKCRLYLRLYDIFTVAVAVVAAAALCCLITHSHTCKNLSRILNENSCFTFIFIPFRCSVFMFNLFPFALIFFIYYVSVWVVFLVDLLARSACLSFYLIIIVMRRIGIHVCVSHKYNNQTNIVHVLWFFKFFSVSKFISRSLSQCICSLAQSFGFTPFRSSLPFCWASFSFWHTVRLVDCVVIERHAPAMHICK